MYLPDLTTFLYRQETSVNYFLKSLQIYHTPVPLNIHLPVRNVYISLKPEHSDFPEITPMLY